MIDHVLHEVKKRIPELRNENLTAMTYATGGSGLNDDGKVLLFVFKRGASTPLYAAKTVRSPRGIASLQQEFESLTLLHGVDTKDAALFAKPLFYSQDPHTGIAFFLEEYVFGIRKRSWARDEEDRVLRAYMQFQKHAKQNGTVSMQDVIAQLARTYITDDPEALVAAAAKVGTPPPLPAMLQHGDLTQDNVLFGDTKVVAIDYEHVHLTKLPGYDLYHLLERLGYAKQEIFTRLQEYARELGFAYTPEHLQLFALAHELIETDKKKNRMHTPLPGAKHFLGYLAD